MANVSSEILRRWKRTSTSRPFEEVEDIRKAYMDDLAARGYHLEWRTRVLRSSLVVTGRILKKVLLKKTERNRKGPETAVRRRVQKLCGAAAWFNQKRADEVVEDEDSIPKGWMKRGQGKRNLGGDKL